MEGGSNPNNPLAWQSLLILAILSVSILSHDQSCLITILYIFILDSLRVCEYYFSILNHLVLHLSCNFTWAF